MKKSVLNQPAVSGNGGNLTEPLTGLSEGTVLPQCSIYNSLDDDLIESFSSANGWHLVVDEGGAASSIFQNGVLKIDIADGGRIWYAVQVCYLPLPITSGIWKVVFDARSSRPRKMILDIAHVGDDWFAFAGRPVFRLTPEWTTCEFTFFNDTRIEPMARFEFNLGGESIGAEFRSLRITSET